MTFDLRQHVNPYIAAPIVNAPVAFVTVYIFLRLGHRRQTRLRKPHAGPELQSVVEHVEALRADYAAGLHTLPHLAAHAEAVMEEARAKVASHHYFQPQIEPEPEPSREDNKHE